MAGPRLQGLIESAVDLCQEIENYASDLYTRRTIDTAAGDVLDTIGEIVGQLRGGLSDDDYRNAIRFRIQLNVSCGQPDVVSDGLKFFTSASRAQLVELTPATFSVWCNASVIPDGLFNSMEAIRPAGVQMYLSYVLSDDALTFAAEGGLPQEGAGYAELSYAPGGAISERVLS